VTATESVRNASAAPAIWTPFKQRRVQTTMRRRGRILPSLIMAALAAGCGGAPRPTNPAVTGPHGIPAIPIPGGLGYGEARFESSSEATPGQREKRGKRTGPTKATDVRKGSSARIVVYFLEPDGKTPLNPLPEKVQAVIGMPGTFANKYTKAYDLTIEPRGDDPVASARFASIPFKLPEQRITGRITAVLRGQEVSFPLVLSGVPIK
jgi:hypothetical protein